MKPKFKAKPPVGRQAHTDVGRANEVQRLLLQALAHHQKNQLGLAQIGYEQVLALSPHNFDALHMLGVLCTQTQQPQLAVDLIQQAIHTNPRVAGAYVNLGVALRQLKLFDEAVDSYDHALALEPNDAQTHTNRGVALRSLKRYLPALESYNTALRIDPKLVEAHYNRGLVRNDLNLLTEALQDFETTLALRPSYHPAQWAKALCLLQLRQFQQAWPLYELRWQQDEKEFTSQALRTSVAKWQPGAMPQRLLVWAEQGVGDELMFGALLPQVRQHTRDLMVQLDARLIPMFQRGMPGITFVPKHEPVDEALYDAHAPMGDLASVFCRTEQSFQAIQPAFVKADPERVTLLRKLVNPDGKRLCGISWRSKNIKKGEDRSLPLVEMLQALAHPAIRFVNLQYGDVQEELLEVQQALGIEVIQCSEVDNRSDLDGLAALVQACDWVISADNSTVHLAGALGQTVWILLPFNADWRWGLNSADSLWYPSAKLYRQTQLNNWQDVLSRVSDSLMKRCDGEH